MGNAPSPPLPSPPLPSPPLPLPLPLLLPLPLPSPPLSSPPLSSPFFQLPLKKTKRCPWRSASQLPVLLKHCKHQGFLHVLALAPGRNAHVPVAFD